MNLPLVTTQVLVAWVEFITLVVAFLLGITNISVLDGDHLDLKRQVTALQNNVKLTTIVTLAIAWVEFTLVAEFLAGIT